MDRFVDWYSGKTMSRKCANRIFFGTTTAIHLFNCLISRWDLAYVIPATLFIGFVHLLWWRMVKEEERMEAIRRSW